jgi:hypothetical protein
LKGCIVVIAGLVLAAAMGPLLDALAARGYRWVTLEQALAHPAYGRRIDGFTGLGGITWLHRWAITEGRDRAIFAGEPEVPEWVEAARAASGR